MAISFQSRIQELPEPRLTQPNTDAVVLCADNTVQDIRDKLLSSGIIELTRQYKQLGLSWYTAANLDTGNKFPKLKTLQKLSQLFEVQVIIIFGNYADTNVVDLIKPNQLRRLIAMQMRNQGRYKSYCIPGVTATSLINIIDNKKGNTPEIPTINAIAKGLAFSFGILLDETAKSKSVKVVTES